MPKIKRPAIIQITTFLTLGCFSKYGRKLWAIANNAMSIMINLSVPSGNQDVASEIIIVAIITNA